MERSNYSITKVCYGTESIEEVRSAVIHMLLTYLNIEAELAKSNESSDTRNAFAERSES